MGRPYFEVNHGPILVDNNIFGGGGVLQLSEGCIFAHNLFLDCPVVFHGDQRVTPYYKPHSTEVAGKKEISPCDGRWFNNVFYRHGLESMKEMPGFKSDSNVFLGGAQKGAYDHHSQVLTGGEFWLSEITNGVKLVSALPVGVLEHGTRESRMSWWGRFRWSVRESRIRTGSRFQSTPIC